MNVIRISMPYMETIMARVSKAYLHLSEQEIWDRI